MLVFLFGGVIAVYEGIHHVLEPIAHKGSYLWNYVVLMIAFIVEGASLVYGIKSFKKESDGKNFIKALRDSKDASTIAVILEESAAMLGIVVAIIGTFLTQITNNMLIDGITSITIGVLLFSVAFFLAKETKGLLIGEGVNEEMEKTIKQIIIESGKVLNILDFRTIKKSTQQETRNKAHEQKIKRRENQKDKRNQTHTDQHQISNPKNHKVRTHA